MILALPCVLSVITPAWLPVNERASWPRLPIAIASSAIEIRSPAVSSMSSSRRGGSGETCSARSISSSVVSPIARDHDDDVVAGALGVDDALGDPLDALGIGDGGTAVLLHDNAHGSPQARAGWTAPILPARPSDADRDPRVPGTRPGSRATARSPRRRCADGSGARSAGQADCRLEHLVGGLDLAPARSRTRGRAGRGRPPTAARAARRSPRRPRRRRRRTATTTAPRPPGRP